MRSFNPLPAVRFTALLVAFVMLGACAANQRANPVGAAHHPETTALALYGSYTIVQGAAVDLAENPQLPKNIRDGLIAADEVAYPIVKNLRPLAEEVQRIMAELAAGATTEDKLAIAIANLNDWITRAAPLIKSVSDSVTKAKGPSP